MVFSLEFPHFDTIACKRWTELKGVVVLGGIRVHIEQHGFSCGNLKEAAVDSHGGVHEGLANWFATLGHPHFRVRGGYVCGSGLVPPVGLCKRAPEKYDFVNALQLCPAHRLVVIGHVLAELHRHLEAPRLRGVDLEDRCAAEDFAPPFLQDLCLDACAMAAIIAWRTSSGLMAHSAPRFSKGRSPSLKEMRILWGMVAGDRK